MLKEIRCEQFNNKVIMLKRGLNIILGDENGSNSIGKSTFLLIIDYIYGGTTYVKEKKDAIRHLGHHEFCFTFEFDNEHYYFARSTETSNEVFICDNDYNQLERISLKDYTKLLHKLHGINNSNLSFREFVSLFSRIWGKHNNEVKRPLHSTANEKNVETVEKLIKYFDRGKDVSDKANLLKQYVKTKSALLTVSKNDIIPLINKRKYNQNVKDLIEVEKDLSHYGEDYLQTYKKVRATMSDYVLELQSMRENLVLEKQKYETRLKRVEKSIEKNVIKRNKKYMSLVEIFPNVNLQKLNEIDDFHYNLTRILESELKTTQLNLVQVITDLENEIYQLDSEISNNLSTTSLPESIIKTLVDLNARKTAITLENKYYNEKLLIVENVAKTKNELALTKELILADIQKKLNDEMKKLNEVVYLGKRQPPSISLTSSNYIFNFMENTGTGKAYTNLILFDLAMFTLTKLPMLIHDTILFKNIENDTMDGLLKLYSSYDKQVFISMDEKDKYNEYSKNIIVQNSILKLSKERVLFVLDWGRMK